MTQAQTQPVPAEKLLTMRSGGWVIALAVLGTLAILVWGLAGTVLREASRPPGDGKTIASYGVATSPCTVDESMLVPATLYRDMVPVLDAPTVVSIDDLDAASGNPRKKPLVPADRIVGVVIDDQPRAYPVSVLNVHEIINDTIAGVPVAVTYCWLTDSAIVFDRRHDDGILSFGHSGLVYNSNLVMYDRTPGLEPHALMPESSLWCQMSGSAITGPAAAAGRTLRVIPSTVVNWTTWRDMHPDTQVVAKEPALVKRYKKASPMQYFRGGKTVFPYEPALPGLGLGALDRVILVTAGGTQRIYPFTVITTNMDAEHGWNVDQGDARLRLTYRTPSVDDDKNQPATVFVENLDEPGQRVETLTCLWFAANAFHGDVDLVQ